MAQSNAFKFANNILTNGGYDAADLVGAAAAGASAFRNIVINGDMQVAQRNTSVASITADGYYTCDRMGIIIGSLGTWTQSQSTDVPTGQGFSKSLKMDCTTADASPAAGDYLILQQKIEGQNLQYLKKGTANAQSLTLSFWVKSTKTGTFIAELLDNDNSRTINKSYTVSVSNTWEKKTITFEGDTTGAFDNDNASSLQLQLWLGSGSDFNSGTLQTTWASITNANRAVGQVNIADSTSNDWYITGIQLEAGTSATDFEFLPSDVSFQRCERYYETFALGCNGVAYASDSVDFAITFKTIKRAAPSSALLDTSIVLDKAATGSFTSSGATIQGALYSKGGGVLRMNGWSGLTAGSAQFTVLQDTDWVAFSSEL